MLAHERGRGDRRHDLVEQLVALHGIEAATSEAHGEIDVVTIEVDRRGAGHQAHAHVRQLRVQRGQARQQPARRERRRDADHQFALAALLAQGLHAARDPFERLAEVLGRELPVARQLEPAARALEQRDAQELLEAADLVTDRRGSDVQLACGPGEAERPGGGLERAQRRQRRQRTGHR